MIHGSLYTLFGSNDSGIIYLKKTDILMILFYKCISIKVTDQIVIK